MNEDWKNKKFKPITPQLYEEMERIIGEAKDFDVMEVKANYSFGDTLSNG